jgi:phage tail sheath protein FI
VVGIYNREDTNRGVHKAPANQIVLGAIDVELQLSKGEQDVLNPIGVNCIRSFPGRGSAYGARTMSSNGAWRYVNVRRLFIMVEASMEAGLSWVVFEPNDATLWAKVVRDVSSFLKVVWRSGALFGTTPEQAFYVKCDEDLNPSEIRDLGQLIIEVGMSPVKPAEFVIFRISQWAGPNAS